MYVPLTRDLARKGKPVHLRRDLPPGFGNQRPILPNSYSPGYIDSSGFVNGLVHVSFGSEQTFFNPDAALLYLECDPWQ